MTPYDSDYDEYISCDTGDCGECEYCADLEALRNDDDEYAFGEAEDAYLDSMYEERFEMDYGDY